MLSANSAKSHYAGDMKPTAHNGVNHTSAVLGGNWSLTLRVGECKEKSASIVQQPPSL